MAKNCEIDFIIKCLYVLNEFPNENENSVQLIFEKSSNQRKLSGVSTSDKV